MERDVYWKCRRALEEAREALNTVATTHSLAVAAAACRRALRLCCLLDRELNGTDYPPDLAPGPMIETFRNRHPRLFEHESILHPALLLAAVDWRDEEVSLGSFDVQAELEQVFLPAARALRLMLDEVAAGLRKPRRCGWRTCVALLLCVLFACAFGWVHMMASADGLTVTYFRGKHFEKPIVRMVEKQIEVSYGENRYSLFHNRFSARWAGTLVVPTTTNYSFYGQNEGGLRVSIDGKVVLENWREVAWKASGTHGDIALTAGNHPILVEYFKSTGHGALRLRWAGGPIPDDTVLGVPYLKR